MKRLSILIAFLLISFAGVVSANAAYTAFVAVDDTLDFDLLDGFTAKVDGIADPQAALDLNVYFMSGKDLHDMSHTFVGAVPDDIVAGPTTIMVWDFFLTTYGADASKELDDGVGVNLVPGMVFSLTADTAFGLTVELWSNDTPLGEYDKFYTTLEEIVEGGKHYTVSAVPIPGTVLLLGSGLLGVMGIGRRRMKKS